MDNYYTMYIDDLRTPIKDFDYIARSFEEAVEIFKKYGVANFISFDHDLGMVNGKICKSGFDIVKWIVKNDLNKEYKIPLDFSFKVHSQNPVGKKNIELLLIQYLEFKSAENIYNKQT